MKINSTVFQDALAEFQTPYHFKNDDKLEGLLAWMKDETVEPFEYVHYIYREWGPDKVIPSILYSDKAKNAFKEFQRSRRAETGIRLALEKDRLKYLLSEGEDVKDVITSELETFCYLLKYVLANIGGLDGLKERFEPGAVYEIKTMPEVKKHLSEFGERYFPKV